MAEIGEEIKSPLMKVKEENEKANLKLNIKKIKIMASGPITSWQIEGEKVEAVTEFLFLGSKITVDGDCSHEIQRGLLFGRKAMTNLDGVLKSKDITLPTMVIIVKNVVFPVVRIQLWELDHEEGIALKNWCLQTAKEDSLRVPLTAKRSNQSILQEINHEYSLGLMLKLKLKYFGHLMQTANSMEETLMPGKIEDRGEEGNREPDVWTAWLTQWT